MYIGNNILLRGELVNTRCYIYNIANGENLSNKLLLEERRKFMNYKPEEKYGMLVLKERFQKTTLKGKKYWCWKCLCDCGNETIIYESNVNRTQSCGCILKEKKLRKDLTGQKFDRLYVVKRSPDRIRSNGRRVVQYECLCDCGNTCYVDGVELTKGATRSCGCLQKETKINLAENLIGKVFGFLKVEERLESVKYLNSKTHEISTMSKWRCRCLNCGGFCDVLGVVLRRGQISCGCVNSKREIEIGEWLTNHGFDFEKQYFFDDLGVPNGRPYYFDFAIHINGELILIEHQGLQHFVDGKFGKFQREVSDPEKKKYCEDHHIKLLEIRYDEPIENKLNLLYGNSVPSSNKEKV